MNVQIPRIIHYCWFGGNPLPELAQHCIESWKKYCPDCEIMRWDETNYDVNSNAYAKEAYKARKWAFVSDIARLHAMVNYGGIYMDTDMELIKPIDDLLEYEAVSGFESANSVAAGLMTCTKGHKLYSDFRKLYEDAHFMRPDGTLDVTTNVSRLTDMLVNSGLVLNNKKQTVAGMTIVPSDYFYPKSYNSLKPKITENTYAIHHYDASWQSEEEKFRHKTYVYLAHYLPRKYVGYITAIIADIKYKGVSFTLRRISGKITGKTKVK